MRRPPAITSRSSAKAKTTHEDENGHWVTIDGHHVFIQEAHGEQPHHGDQKRSRGHIVRAERRPGAKAARIIFNETSGLRPASKNPEDLHDARVAMAHALLNASGMSHPPATVSDTLTSSSARAILTDAKAQAAWANSQDALQEAAASTDDTNGAIHFFLDYQGAKHPDWAVEDR
jgi:hypothetical protein